ncbi:MAG TPA: Xaa-Pro peptidase family protein [Gaiellaceae bacterium]|nr:Xaa-Pro peptidase family protein [Gaiellaceae bacterium]
MSTAARSPVRRVPEPSYPNFPKAEIDERCRRARAAMERDGIDLLLLTERENVVYFSGLSSMAWVQKGVVPAVVLVAVDEDEPTMVLPDFWLGTAEKTTWLDDFVLHRASHSNPDDFANLVAEVVRERGYGGRRIGFEAGHEMLLGLPIGQWETLRRALADATWVNAGDTIWDVRMIKSEREIDRLRRAAVATNRAQEQLRGYLRLGMSELEAGAFLRRAMIQDDAGEEDRLFLNFRAGRDRYSMTDTYPKDRPIGRGDLLVVDAGIVLDGYSSDTARVIAIGEPSELHASVYRTVVEARRRALELLKPGVLASELYRAVRGAFDEAGLPAHIDMVGHGIGLDVHEPPMLSPANDTPIEENMVLCIEPWVTLPNDQGVLVIEDTFAVRPGGYEELTLPHAGELWVAAR